MTYPKPVMSLTELAMLGFPKHSLRKWVHIKGFPAWKTSPGSSKYLVDTCKFDYWFREHAGKV